MFHLLLIQIDILKSLPCLAIKQQLSNTQNVYKCEIVELFQAQEY